MYFTMFDLSVLNSEVFFEREKCRVYDGLAYRLRIWNYSLSYSSYSWRSLKAIFLSKQKRNLWF